MKKSFKKAIAILLSVMMIVCAFPMSAFAADAKKPNVTLQFGAMYASAKNRTMQNYMNGNPDNFAQSGLNSTDLEFANGTLTLKASSAKAQQTVTSNSLAALTKDYTYGEGDFFTATVLLENVSKLAATQVAIKYSENIAPAGYDVDEMSMSTDAAEYSDYEPGVAIADQSANTLYNDVQTVGEISYIDTENHIMYVNVAVQDGTDYIDTSSTVFTDKAGKTINEFTNTAVLATFAFGIVGDGPIAFSMADAENEEDGFYLASVADDAMDTEGNYVTYAKTNEDGTNGSAGMTFMGRNENVAAPTSTVTFIDEKGATISATEYEVGATVDVPTLPQMTKDADNHYTYAWDTTPATVAGAEDATYTIVKTPAAHAWNAGVTTTEPTTETEGVKTYTCTVCSQTKTEKIDKLPPAHVHSWGQWVYNGDAFYGGSSNYKNGTQTRTCACGESETKEAPHTGLLSKRATQLSVDTAILAKISTTKADADYYDEVYMVAELDTNKGHIREVITDKEVYYGAYYRFTFGKTTPYYLNEPVTYTFYGVKDGVTYWGDSFTYSAMEYVLSTFDTYSEAKYPTTYKNLRNLLADIVVYGEMSQKQANYGITDGLKTPMTSYLTAQQLGYATKGNLNLQNIGLSTYETITGPTAQTGFGVRMGASVDLAITLAKLNNNCPDLKTLIVEITKEGQAAQRFSYADNEDMFAINGQYLVFYYDGVKGYEASTPVYVRLLDKDGKVISNTRRCSIESYCYQQINNASAAANLKNVCDAIMRYAKSSAAYVANQKA